MQTKTVARICKGWAALNFELDDLMPLVEAGELLGLANLERGAFVLTPLGHTYAEASILARKELLAGRVLRLPLISWIYDTLQRDDTRSTARSYFFDKLQGEFGDQAEEQLDTAIRCGRMQNSSPITMTRATVLGRLRSPDRRWGYLYPISRTARQIAQRI